jgi:hypothetical protein
MVPWSFRFSDRRGRRAQHGVAEEDSPANVGVGGLGDPGVTKKVAGFGWMVSGGYLALTSWITPNGLVPVAPVFTAAGGGAAIWDHQPTVSVVAPHGATGITFNYAAPGGAYLATGRST